MITANDETVTVTVEWNVPSATGKLAQTQTSTVTLIENYSTRANIPSILGIARLGSRENGALINVISVTGDENVDWT